MPSKDQMEALSELYIRTHYTVAAIDKSEDEYHKDKFRELAIHIDDLAFHVKQLQLEVLKLEQQLHNKSTR